MDTRYEVSHRKCPRGNWGTCEFTLARAFNFGINTECLNWPSAMYPGTVLMW